jgi:hypothetical protein
MSSPSSSSSGSSAAAGGTVARIGPASAAALVGLRRVDWIRLLVNGDAVGAEAVGVGFRLPATCPISISVAARLIESGVPHVTRHLATRV